MGHHETTDAEDTLERLAPRYWLPLQAQAQGGGGGWAQSVFDRTVLLQPHQPVVHVSWYEASAYARWAVRRPPLPTSDG